MVKEHKSNACSEKNRNKNEACTLYTIIGLINWTYWITPDVLSFQAVEFNHPSILLGKSCSRFKNMFDVMKSTPRGASINEDPPAPERSSLQRPDRIDLRGHLSCPSTSPRVTSDFRFSSTSPMGDLSPLRDSVIYDDDEISESDDVWDVLTVPCLNELTATDYLN